MMEVMVENDPGPTPALQVAEKNPVYLRKSDKNGVKIHIPEHIMLWQLQNYVSNELGIANSRQILFINGKKYYQSPNQLLQIKANTIIHAHEKQTWEYRVICIKVQLLDSENNLKQPKEYTVMRKDTIGQFLE